MHDDGDKRFWTFDVTYPTVAAPLELIEKKACSDLSSPFAVRTTRDEVVRNARNKGFRIVVFSLFENGYCNLEFQYEVSNPNDERDYVRAIQYAFVVNGDGLHAAMAAQ